MLIRAERPEDREQIAAITTAAFADVIHSDQTEAAIVAALRAAGALRVSLVADGDDEIVGHVALSPVTIDGDDRGWFGLGPVSVRPDRQRRGIGGALIRHGLNELLRAGAGGCVVLGDPDYYRRFGFAHDPSLRYDGAPPAYFTRITFIAPPPTGQVAYHPGFAAS